MSPSNPFFETRFVVLNVSASDPCVYFLQVPMTAYYSMRTLLASTALAVFPCILHLLPMISGSGLRHPFFPLRAC